LIKKNVVLNRLNFVHDTTKSRSCFT